MVKLLLVSLLLCASLHAGDRRVRHLPFSLGSGTGGAKLVLFAPALRGFSNGDPVGTWADLSGYGLNAAASGSARGNYTRTGQGGMPSVSLDGSASTLLITSGYTDLFKASDVWTVFIATTPKTTLAGQGIVFGGASGTIDFNFEVKSDGGAYWASDVSNYRTYASPIFAVDASQVYTLEKTGATAGELYLSGVLSSSYTGNFASSPSISDDLAIGGYGVSGGYKYSGDVQSIIVFGSLPMAMIQRIEQSSGYTFRIPTH